MTILVALLPSMFLIACSYWLSKGMLVRRHCLWTGILCGGVSVGVTIILLYAIKFVLDIVGYEAGLEDTPERILVGAFWLAAIPEEDSKMVALCVLIAWNGVPKNRTEGIVYATYIAATFAGIENVLCLTTETENIGTVAVIRAFISVPGHYFDAVFMGYFFSNAFIYKVWWKKIYYGLLAISVPILLHGLFDGLLMTKYLGTQYIPLAVVSFFLFYGHLAKTAIQKCWRVKSISLGRGTSVEQHPNINWQENTIIWG